MKKDHEYLGVKEIARRANVSIGTVDRVIHNRPGVSEATRKKINDIIQELNYQPNILASRLASKKIFHIAVLIPKVSKETDFWEAPLKGIQRAGAEINRFGVTITTCFFDLSDKRSFTDQANAILKKKPDGVLISPSFVKEAMEFTRACEERDIPYVLIDTNLPAQKKHCYIGPHLFYSGYQAAHLIDFGTAKKSRILFLNISRVANDEQLEEGFMTYFKDRNKKPSILKLDINPTTYPSIVKSLTAVFQEHNDIRSIFVTNSRVGSVAHYLAEANIKDVLLIGYDIIKDNLKYLERGVIDFLICHKPEEQGYRGIMALYQSLVLGTQPESVTYMPIDIITRENYKFYSN